MKSEHRHELKTNELERIASDWGHASERYVQNHTNQLVVVAVILAAIAVGVIYWRMSSGSYDRQSWRALSDANSTADYGTVADKYAGTKVAAWARLREGEAELSSGIRLLFTDRDAGRSDLEKAEENFQKLAGDRTAPPEVVERALFSLARCHESLPPKSSGAATVNNAAIETYERLLKEFPDTVYKELAESRVAVLRTGTAQDFNAWFETQNPKPADRAMPKDLSIPPLPEDFGPAAKGNAPASDGKKDNASKGQTPDAFQMGPLTPAAPGKAGGAAPTKPGTKPPVTKTQGGPALPSASGPASK